MSHGLALITGASAGIGEALARRIAREGRPVALVARAADRLEKLAAEIRQQHRVDAHVLPADLTKAGAVRELADEVGRRGLAVDWLVNNAGFGTIGRFDTLPLERELEEIGLNVVALVELTGRFLPAMVARGWGAVINVSSLASFLPGPYSATYSATKAFVTSFSEAISAELKDTGVSVLCVCPGFTRTEFQERAAIDTSRVPGMAWMSAEEVADQTVRAVGQQSLLVNGALNAVTATAVKFVPRGILNRVATTLMRPRAG